MLGWGLSKVWDGLLPLLLALLISSVLWPVVAKLKKWRVPYGLGALISLLLAAGFVAANTRKPGATRTTSPVSGMTIMSP